MTDELDLSKPVQTLDGTPVTILTTEARRSFPVVGLIHEINGDVIAYWRQDGLISVSCGNTNRNLVNVPAKRYVRWLNIYDYGSGPVCGGLMIVRDDRCGDRGRIACIPVEFAEGDGLDGECGE